MHSHENWSDVISWLGVSDETFGDFFASWTRDLMQSPQLKEAAADEWLMSWFIVNSVWRQDLYDRERLDDVITDYERQVSRRQFAD